MLIDCHGITGKQLCLGVQTNKGNTSDRAMFVAKSWQPKKAQSFTIEKVVHTDYHGKPVEEETGYARVFVSYFTGKKEGEHNFD
jgi:hypothetical protein